jgi:cellulose synthase/poly-beta-1,6-N-acetylglucosamine synthase-like glycosyltransferase
MMLVHVIFLVLSVVLTLLFFVYGSNLLYLLTVAVYHRPPDLSPGPPPTPRVAIHLPVYNEKYVMRGIVEACVRMVQAYGADRV